MVTNADDLSEGGDAGEAGKATIAEPTCKAVYLLLEISMAVSFQLGRLSRLSSWQSARIRMATFLYFSSVFLISSSNLPILILLRSSSVVLSSISASFYLIYFRALIWCWFNIMVKIKHIFRVYTHILHPPLSNPKITPQNAHKHSQTHELPLQQVWRLRRIAFRSFSKILAKFEILAQSELPPENDSPTHGEREKTSLWPWFPLFIFDIILLYNIIVTTPE